MEQTALDPHSWDEFIGQERLKYQLQTHTAAAFAQHRPLSHVLLAGPPGFGKTTLSRLIAEAMTDPLVELQMPISRKFLVHHFRMFEGGVMFLDEIHALSRKDQEILLPVLEQGSIFDDRGREFLIPFLTVVAATTERDKLIKPLHDRFPIRPDFVPYTDVELGAIVARMAERAEVTIDVKMAHDLGKASAGVPRMARHFVAAARDLDALDRPVTTEDILELCGVDPDGLTIQHREYLKVLASQPEGMAGEKTIEMVLQSPTGVIRDLERVLLKRQLIEYTRGGRQLTAEGIAKVQGREIRPYSRR